MFHKKISEEERILQRSKARAERDAIRLQKLKDKKRWNTGFEVNEIDEQIKDLKLKKQKEKENDLKQDEVMVASAQESLENEKKSLSLKREQNKEYAKQLLQVKKCERETYDLIDPKHLNKSKPPRVNDTDFIHTSSLQKFDGEDLTFKQRTLDHQKILRKNLENQMNQKRTAQDQERLQTQVYVQQRDYANKVWGEKENETLNKTHHKEVEISKYNQKLSNEQHELLKQQKEAENLQNKEQIEYLKNSNLLSEKYEATIRNDCPHRFIPYDFKGYNTDVSKKFYEDRLDQVQSKKQQKVNANQTQKEWDDIMEKQRKEKLRLEVAEQKRMQQKRKEYAAQLLKQSEEQKKVQEETGKMYSNEVTEDFWSQFGTSFR